LLATSGIAAGPWLCLCQSGTSGIAGLLPVDNTTAWRATRVVVVLLLLLMLSGTMTLTVSSPTPKPFKMLVLLTLSCLKMLVSKKMMMIMAASKQASKQASKKLS
jgi:hypothetical protein